MSSYGVTVDGFVRKPIEITLEEIEDDQKAGLGADFDVSAQSLAGQINGSVVSQLDELWEVDEAIYSSIDPDKASGTALAAVAAFSGTVKEAATHSAVTASVNLDAGKTLVAGAIASVDGSPESRFVTIADATNGGGAPASVDVVMQAESAGIVVANAGTLSVIDTPQSGWNTVTNNLDADLGEESETDEDLRERREEELRRAGAAAVDAIKADVLAVDDVENVTVFENKTDAVDVDGVPAHSFEVVAQVAVGVDEDEIAQAIWDSKAGGIESHGDETATAVDIDGVNHSVDFSFPTEVPIYIDVEVDVNGDYAATGDADIKTALAVFGQANLETSDNVIWSELFGIIFAVSGVVDVTTLEIGVAPAPAGVINIPITSRQLATLDTGDMTVVSTP